MPGVRFPVAEHSTKIFSPYDTLAEWLRRRPAKPLRSPCAGSNPAGVESMYFFYTLYSGACIIETHTCMNAPCNRSICDSYRYVPVAQRIRRETTNLEIAGSNPVGDNFFSPPVSASTAMVLWCNWLSLWTLNPAIRVQIPVEPAAAKNFCLPHYASCITYVRMTDADPTYISL